MPRLPLDIHPPPRMLRKRPQMGLRPVRMLEDRGRLLLLLALGLIGAGLLLAIPGAVLAGVLLVGLMLLEIQRIREALRPGMAPCGVLATLTVDRDQDEQEPVQNPGQRGVTHRVEQPIVLKLRLLAPVQFDGLRVDLQRWFTSPGLELGDDSHRALYLRHSGTRVPLQVLPKLAAVHRILGVQARLVDAMGLLSADIFLPCPCELAVLPRSLPLDLRRLAETRRLSPRPTGSERPDRVPGTGDDLRELREHVAGDPFKHIAWKASAARGRLMSRSFERERTRALHAVLDAGATMRDGRPGHGALDQALDLVHSLAEACARAHEPFGLVLCDGRVVDRRPVLEGLAALRDADRALLDLRRTVAEDLAPMEDDELVATVADYLVAVERVILPPLDGTPQALQERRQRVVMAAMARLPERERSPLLRGPEPASRQDLAILRRYCRAMELALPYRPSLPPEERIRGLVEGLRTAASARKGPFAIVLVSDFRRLSTVAEPLMRACAAVRAQGHQVLAVALREADERGVLELLQDPEEIDAARGLIRSDRAARQQALDELADGFRRVGATFLPDPAPQQVVTLWQHL